MSIIKTSLTIFISTAFFIVLVIGIVTYDEFRLYNTNSIGTINNIQSLQQEATAQTTINSKNNNNNTMTPYSTTSANATNNETTILKQGLVSSSKSQPNETSQVAILLPHRSDGKTYSGTLTYSATSPVEIGLLHGISIDNNTLVSIKSIYGDSAPHWIDYASSKHHLNKTAIQIIAGIKPNYGTSTPYFSASIPFVASSVGLWSPTNIPFIVSYQLSAKVAQPDINNDLQSMDIK